MHLVASWILAGLALVHSSLTPMLYHEWNPDAVWFLGTGLGLLFLAGSNLAHVGLEPCRQPTAPFVRWANVVFLAFGAAALIAVPEPQAAVIFVALAAQAIAGWATLKGPRVSYD
jgi:hypothetical protein